MLSFGEAGVGVEDVSVEDVGVEEEGVGTGRDTGNEIERVILCGSTEAMERIGGGFLMINGRPGLPM